MRPVLLLLLVSLLLTACGGGAATDDPSDLTTSSSAPSDAAVDDDPTSDDGAASSQPVGTDTPVPVEGEGDIGDGQGPAPLAEAPDFGVSSETDSGSISPFTTCWSAPSDDGEATGVCSDGIPQPESLTLAGADQLVVTYAEGDLTASAAAPGEEPPGTELAAEQENPGIWLIDISSLEPGDHVVTLSWVGEQGDATTAFTLTVQR